MAKQTKKSETSSGGSPARSRKPILPGKNSPIDFPKAFRCKGTFLTKDMVGPKSRKLYCSPTLMQ